jgi:hypothetical protein
MNTAALTAARARCAASHAHMLKVRSLDYLLEDDAATELLQRLPAHSRARCALLGKRWRDLVRRPSTWRTIVIDKLVGDADTLAAILRLAGGELTCLRFLINWQRRALD